MIKGSTLRDAIISGANNINNMRSEVDELNVFPVPDGDTGTNMGMTVAAAARDLSLLADDVTVEVAAQTSASAMLRGARGNSGVITSLLFRGFAKALKGKKEADASDIKEALKQGVEAAYKAVMNPTEGTMLTVARVASENANASETDDVKELWDIVVKAGDEALAYTPEQLPVLKKAGVVDAGGQGVMCIFKGMQTVISGGEMIKSMEATPSSKTKLDTSSAGKGVYAETLMSVEDIENGYCTEFLVNKCETSDAPALRAYLESHGDSVVVVDDDEIIKCHVHTKDPGKILSKAITHGYLTNMKIENMHEQFLARQNQGAGLKKQAEAEKEPNSEFVYAAVDSDRHYGFVAVAAGDGLKNIFTDLGADAVVSGGQTMNPSTDDIVSAVQSVPAKTVFVLPNNKNIIMAAEQACKIADRKIVVLPTRTIPQGITAMLTFDPDANSKDNAIAMMNAADGVSTGLITYAARNSDFDGHKIKQGEILALENGKLSFTEKDLQKAVTKLTKNMVKKDSSFVTLISGCDVDEADAEKAVEYLQGKLSSSIEVTHLNGGQPVYYYIVSVE